MFGVMWTLVSIDFNFRGSKVEDGGDIEYRWSYYITVYSEVEIMFCTCTVDSFLNSVNNVVMYDVYVH